MLISWIIILWYMFWWMMLLQFKVWELCTDSCFWLWKCILDWQVHACCYICVDDLLYYIWIFYGDSFGLFERLLDAGLLLFFRIDLAWKSGLWPSIVMNSTIWIDIVWLGLLYEYFLPSCEVRPHYPWRYILKSDSWYLV